MAVSLGDVIVRFLADTSELVAGVEESKGLLGNFGGIAAGVGVAAGAALVGIGVESVKMAGDFQQGLTQLVTGARESQSNLGMVGDGIKQISVESATSTTALTEGMYMIESAGFHGAAGLDVLKASAEGARAGHANLATAAKTVTTMMVDYAAKHYTATEAMNALIATEGAGQMHLEDLGRSMGAVLPLASSLGLSFPQVAGGLAVMTNAGMTAQHASQNLANAIRSLAAPNASAVTSMQAVGLSAQQLKDTLSTQGLSGAIQLIEEHVGKKFPAGSVDAVEAFKHIMGGATGYNVALMLGGDHMKAYEANIKSIGSALSKNASDVEGFSLVQQSFAFQLDKAKMAGNALMITLGQALLPVLTNLLTQITPMIVQFTTWETNTHGVEKGIAAVGAALSIMGGILTTAVGLLAQSGVAVGAVTVWWNTWGPTIEVVGGILLTFFLPALIKTGVEAAISGVQLASSFIVNIVKTGVEALIAGPKLAISFVSNVIDAGVQGWASAGKLAVFIGNLIKTGVEAALAGAKIAVSFVANMVKAGAEALLAGAKIAASFVVSMVQAGTAAVLSGAKIVASFVASLITTAAQAIATGATMMAELVPAIIAVATEGLVAAATAIPGLVVGFIAWATTAGAAAIATIAATWPILAIIVAIGLLIAAIVLLYTHWSQVTAFLVTAWKNATSFIATEANNLAGLAVQWGRNLIAGFVNGIMSMVGAVGNAVSSVGNTIKNFLGIHSPAKMGPLAELDQWPKNLVKTYAGGLVAGSSTLASASSSLVTPMSRTLSTPSPGGATRSQTAHIHVYLGGKEIVSQLMPMVYDEARAMTGWRPVG